MLRREHLDILLTDLCFDPKALLESIVAQMSEDEYWQALEYIARIEDWEAPVKESIRTRSSPHLEADTLNAIFQDIRASFEPEELQAFKSFDDFWDQVDQNNGYEEDWDKDYYRPYYVEIFNLLKKGAE